LIVAAEQSSAGLEKLSRFVLKLRHHYNPDSTTALCSREKCFLIYPRYAALTGLFLFGLKHAIIKDDFKNIRA